MNRVIYLYLYLILTMVSCGSIKNMTYFENMPKDIDSKILQNYELKIQKDDLLGIKISCQTPDLLIPFMPSSTTTSSVSEGGTVQSGSASNKYLVSAKGEIKFPLLGSINVEGMTHVELEDKITNLLIDRDYIKDPTVSIDLENFKISFLGEIGTVGTVTILSDRITIFQALSMTGDLTIYGKRINMSVIRESGGKRIVANVDINSKDIFDSPYYYLQPNDVIYVEPNDSLKRTSTDSKTVVTWILSTLSVVLSTVAIFMAF